MLCVRYSMLTCKVSASGPTPSCFNDSDESCVLSLGACYCFFCFFNTKYRIDKLLVLWQPYCSPLQLPTVWAFHYMQVNSSSKITSSVSLAKNTSVQNIQQRLLILKTTNRYHQLINRWFGEQLDDGPEWILAVVRSKCSLQAGVVINFISII